jgi:cytochrome oxidase assembly protein ShyY1
MRQFHRKLFISVCRLRNRHQNAVSRSLSSSNNQSGYDYAGMLLFGGISLGTCGLGVWQLSRYYEKIASRDENVDAASQEMLAFPDYMGDDEITLWAKNNKSRKLQLVGTYEHSNEIRLGLRSLPSGQAQGLASNPQGFYIITPFRLLNGLVYIWCMKLIVDLSCSSTVVGLFS